MNETKLPLTPKPDPDTPARPGTETPPVACAVVQDLMPLVRDGVASPESEMLVKAHIATCPDCRALWDALPAAQAEPVLPDDEAVLHKVKARVSLWLLIVVVAGLLMGMTVMNSGRAIGLIFVIFPLTCGVARWFDDGIWKLVPVFAAAIVLIQSLPNLFAAMEFTTFASALFSYLQGVCMPALLLAVICLAGALTASLLRYAVKGKGKDKQ